MGCESGAGWRVEGQPEGCSEDLRTFPPHSVLPLPSHSLATPAQLHWIDSLREERAVPSHAFAVG